MKIECVILTILIFGTIGGIVNKFRDKDIDSKYWKSILKGIGAALIVPLFLELVRSDIISIDQNDWYNYFVFGGLCLVTSIFSDKFFDSLGNKILSKVKNVEKTVKEIEDSKNEIEDADEIIFDNIESDNKIDIKADIQKVVRAILNSKYSYRTISGINKETKLDNDKIIGILVTLRDNGFAENKKNKKGNEIWKIIVK